MTAEPESTGVNPTSLLQRVRGAASRRAVQQMKQALSEFAPQEREALLRYVERQAPERYCDDLGFSPSAFDALRRRLKTRVIQLGGQSATQQGLERLASRLLPKLA